MEQYTYLLINILTILVPLVMSFEKKIHFVSEWKYVFPAIFINSIYIYFMGCMVCSGGSVGFHL